MSAAAVLLATSLGSVSGSASSIPVIDDSQLQAMTTTMGGAQPLATSQTVPHWWGSALDPHDGVTYGYNMVGADPNSCSGSACSASVTVDITPINVNFEGMTFNGSDVVGATLASPQFATNDYGSTPYATSGASNLTRGAGGTLSQGDKRSQLQLEDATMRAQFNKTGSSPYHVVLNPVVHPAITIDAPTGNATLLKSGRGVIFADLSVTWWAGVISSLMGSADPTHLPLYLTNNVLLHTGNNLLSCCIIGFHGAAVVNGHGGGSVNGNGDQPVQTFSWASWVQPGLYSRANGGTDWALQDIHALSHEISEWADDPFVNNKVEPWLTPTAPQYGCTGVMETGDPVVAIGFAKGANTFEQGPNPNGTQSADGYYHPEDEVFLPWFMRTSPNTISEPTQTATPNGGRYTLMGVLNRFAGFGEPATGC